MYLLKMHVGKIRAMIHKHCCVIVPICCHDNFLFYLCAGVGDTSWYTDISLPG